MDLQKKVKKNSTRDYDARWFHPSVRDAHTRAHFAIFSDIVVHKIAKIKKLNSYPASTTQVYRRTFVATYIRHRLCIAPSRATLMAEIHRDISPISSARIWVTDESWAIACVQRSMRAVCVREIDSIHARVDSVVWRQAVLWAVRTSIGIKPYYLWAWRTRMICTIIGINWCPDRVRAFNFFTPLPLTGAWES